MLLVGSLLMKPVSLEPGLKCRLAAPFPSYGLDMCAILAPVEFPLKPNPVEFLHTLRRWTRQSVRSQAYHSYALVELVLG